MTSGGACPRRAFGAAPWFPPGQARRLVTRVGEISLNDPRPAGRSRLPGGRDDFWLQCRDVPVARLPVPRALALLIGLPFGIALTRLPRIAPAVISILGTLQTIPALALLGFCISVLHLIGSPVAVIAAVVYSIFPIALNTYTGIVQVDPRLKDAGRGDRHERSVRCLRHVELPLAMPVLLAGVRTLGAVLLDRASSPISAIVGARRPRHVHHRRQCPRGDVPLILSGVRADPRDHVALFVGLSGLAILTKRRAEPGLLARRLRPDRALGSSTASASADREGTSRSPATPPAAALEASTSPAPSLAETWRQSDDFARQTLIFLSLMARGLGLAAPSSASS